ncbi:MAG TPA: ABC transporter permease, partial [Firmicutes bacterium]|nr:ABC transporter permease [Bacillota bacterium]
MKATHIRKEGQIGDIVFKIINYSVFTIFTIACIYPFYYLFINTISDNSLVQRGLITLFPRGIHFVNYVALTEVNELGTS